jgi:pyruvate dehydrogenase E1 component alpha subunit
MRHTVASFHVDCVRFIDAAGEAPEPLPDVVREAGALEALYRAMVRTRSFDARAVALQRTGRLGTFASSLGQEAVSVGMAAAMREEDVLLPSFRESGAQLLRGVSELELLLYWGGDERGSDFQGPRQDFPVCIPVGSHAAHAAGVALAFRLRGEARVAVCCFGDGATSKGDVYEAMNLAGVHRLPLVLVVNNNQWAISVPRVRQSAAQTLAQKAIAAGFDGVQVDGNDVVAVRHVVGEAIEAARAGAGPMLVEALTYRLADHTTADDASRYRDDDEVSARWKEEPVLRLRRYLERAGRWDGEREEQLLAGLTAGLDRICETYEQMPPQPPEAMFDFLHAELPRAWRAQRERLIAPAAGACGDDARGGEGDRP